MKMYKMVILVVLFLQIILGFFPTTTEAFSPCREVSGVNCPNGNVYTDQRSISTKILSTTIPIVEGLLLVFLIYKIFKKWKKLWGLGIYLCVLLSIVLGTLLTQINSLRNNLEDLKIYGKILSILNYPGMFVAEKINHNSTSMISFLLVNAIVYTLIGWILYTIFKKKTNNIENGTKT